MPGRGPRQQSLAAAGRSAHNNIVPAGGGYFQGPFDMLLSFYFCHIDAGGNRRSFQILTIGQVDRGLGISPQIGGSAPLEESKGRIRVPSIKRGLPGIYRRHDDIGEALLEGHAHHGQNAAGMTQSAIHRKLTQENRASEIGI